MLRLADVVDRHRRLVLLALFAAVTLEALLNYPPAGVDDEAGYLKYSHALLDGHYWRPRYEGQFTWWGPGLPVLLSPFVAAGSPLLLTRLVFGPLLVVAAVAFTWKALLVDTGPRLAALASVSFGLLAIYLGSGLVRYGSVYSEPATGLAISVALYFWIKCRTDGRARFALGAGLALAAAAMIRVEWGLIISAGLVLALIVLPFRPIAQHRLALLSLVVATSACLPWLGYTHNQSGEYFIWGTSGGLSAYWTAAARPPLQGDWLSPERVASDSRLEEYRSAMSHDRFKYRGPFLWDSYLKSTSIERMIEDPIRFAFNLGKNFTRLVSRYPLSFKPTPQSALLVAVPSTLALLIGLLTGILLTLRRRWRLVALAPVFGLVANLVLHLATSAVPRFIYPMLPLLVWFVWRGATVLRQGNGDQPDARAAPGAASAAGADV